MGVRLTGPRDLQPEDDFSSFDCGDEKINKWAKTYAHYNKRNNLNYIRVITAKGSAKVLAFYALTTREIEYSKLGILGDEFLAQPPRTVPAYFIGQFGVDRALQGQGIGSGLVKDIYKFALEQCHSGLPAPLFYLDLASRRARGFWAHMGFKRCPDIAPRAMIKELAEIEDTARLLKTNPLLKIKVFCQSLCAILAKFFVKMMDGLLLGNRR